MMEPISDLPEGVVGIIASGAVTASDYETVLMPAVRSALAEHGGIRLIYQLGPAFSGFSAGAMWDDLKLGLSHLRAWRRIAVITDLDWVTRSTRLFDFAMPCPVKVFPNGALGKAKKWIAQGA